MPCPCAYPWFIDGNDENILTGESRIITYNNIRKLFKEGWKYRKSTPVSFKEAISVLILRVNTSLGNWFTKHYIHKTNISGWKQNIFELGADKTSELFRQPKYNTSSIFKEHHSCNNLKDLEAKHQLLRLLSGNSKWRQHVNAKFKTPLLPMSLLDTLLIIVFFPNVTRKIVINFFLNLGTLKNDFKCFLCLICN